VNWIRYDPVARFYKYNDRHSAPYKKGDWLRLKKYNGNNSCHSKPLVSEIYDGVVSLGTLFCFM
jgi:hypothetical protein